MANVTKISLDGTPYDIADNTARTTATSAKSTADAAKAVTVKYNTEQSSLVVTTGIALS